MVTCATAQRHTSAGLLTTLLFAETDSNRASNCWNQLAPAWFTNQAHPVLTAAARECVLAGDSILDVWSLGLALKRDQGPSDEITEMLRGMLPQMERRALSRTTALETI
jgi:hypothetical protein